VVSPRLPEKPDLDQYRTQAKELRDSLRAAEPAALERLAHFHPRTIEPATAKLADAQLIIAREHGCASWPELKGRIAALTKPASASFPTRLRCENGELGLEIAGLEGARGIVLFVLAAPADRMHKGMRQIADHLRRAGLCTVMADLLTDDEAIQDAIEEDLRFDVPLLARRATIALDWIRADKRLSRPPLALFASHGAGAAAIMLSAQFPGLVQALVSCAGRPDLAGSSAWQVRAPTLFIVGGDDAVAHGFTKLILDILPRDVPSRLDVVDGVGLRFDEGPAAARAAALTVGWLGEHLGAHAGGGL
jgi:dienelactone hydrolase